MSILDRWRWPQVHQSAKNKQLDLQIEEQFQNKIVKTLFSTVHNKIKRFLEFGEIL